VGHGKSILIVEDDDDVRGALATFLEGEGYSVVEAEHGEAALRRLRSSPDFCLIVLDLFMPVMNGWDFRAEQKADAKLAGIPIVIVTADREAAQHAAELGAIAQLRKPIEFRQLLEYVQRHC